METVVKVENLLQSKLRLERDKGVVQLKDALMKDSSGDVAKALLSNFQKEISSSNEDTDWEMLHGCLLGTKCILRSCLGKPDVEKRLLNEESISFFHQSALNLLQHPEVRVRTEAGEVLRVLCELKGSQIYEKCSSQVLKLLQGDLQRRIDPDISGQEDEDSSSPPSSSGSDSANIFHESAGWRYLETTMKSLQCMIEGCGESFNPYITQDLLNLLFSALGHTNRFVRETGFNVCAALVKCGTSSESDSILKYGEQLSRHFAEGLADNWSQVRLASSVATRSFLSSVKDPEKRARFFPDLIPRLCLNRYYIAEGVRIYSQETWSQVSGGKGKELVEKYISDVTQYYIRSTQADNHAVREAACACISELATKINPVSVRQYVPALLGALLDCFQDDSWPVRDAACVACGNFLLSYGAEAREKREMLYELFLGNLRDPIPSVREGAGVALAKYVKAYGDAVLPEVLKELEEGLEDIKSQPENSDKFIGLDKKPAQFGVVKSLHDEDKQHTDQQMYSCGSLAPKMGRGKRGGCTDFRFRKPSEPWERADGCVYLITELAAYYPQQSAKLLPCVVKALSKKHFPQHVVFLETVCKQLPKIATKIGKRAFKMHLEAFFDAIFEALSVCDVQLTIAAAEDCLVQLGRFLGPSILRGRVENYNTHYLEQYDRVVQDVASGHHAPFPTAHIHGFKFVKT